MELCYYCGKETSNPIKCPYCGLKFCDEHLDPTAHNCIMYEETSSFKRIETEKSSETIIDEKQVPIEPPHRVRRQGNQKT